MRMGIYSKIKGIKFQKCDIATDKNINGTANYSMRDFELYLMEKSCVPVCLALATEAKVVILFIFSFLDEDIYSLRKPLNRDRQLPISPQRTLAHSSVLLLQLLNSTLLFLFLLFVQKLVLQAKGHPHDHSLLGTGLRRKFFSLKLQ